MPNLPSSTCSVSHASAEPVQRNWIQRNLHLKELKRESCDPGADFWWNKKSKLVTFYVLQSYFRCEHLHRVNHTSKPSWKTITQLTERYFGPNFSILKIWNIFDIFDSSIYNFFVFTLPFLDRTFTEILKKIFGDFFHKDVRNEALSGYLRFSK